MAISDMQNDTWVHSPYPRCQSWSECQQIVETDCSSNMDQLPDLYYIVGSESIAMFGSFGLVAVWCFTVWKSHLTLQRESKVLLLGFLMESSSYDLNQWLWRYALFKIEISLQCFPSF